MAEKKYIIGTGYFEARPEQKEFSKIWWDNVRQFADVGRVALVAVGGCVPAFWPMMANGLKGNLGHINDLVVEKTKAHQFCGWSASMLALAMIAYCDEADFIYKEQDCLAFGPWVERIYEEVGDAPVIFGSCEIQPAAQSLFMVKHAYIPEFVRLYLSAGQDNDEQNLPEMKFARLEKEHNWKRFSFGFDRDRPAGGVEMLKNIHQGDANFVSYIQQITASELDILRRGGLI